MTIRYTVEAARPGAHVYRVTMSFDLPDDVPSAGGQRIAFANWIPGSYMIREFAKSVLRVGARAAGKPVALSALDKSSWQLPAGLVGEVVLELEIYARDPSVRAAWLDPGRSFFNGTSLFPYLPDRLDEEVTLDIAAPAHTDDWTVATTLSAATVDAAGFGTYRAADYDELVDHPVEIGALQRVTFNACGVPHEMAIAGGARFDSERLAADLETICEAHIRFFGEPAPMPRFLFQTALVDAGYGGLEHRASTALMATRDALPVPVARERSGKSARSDDYVTFLGLCSHEYFHTWNVKRIKPARFIPYDFNREVHTRLLWFFEGVTSYYDDLAMVRAGLIDRAKYFELVAHTVTRVQRGAGRNVQSVTDSSRDAWTKFYKQDENAPNAIVSYYAKGMLISLCLDAWIREATDGERSLDDLMRDLWQRWLATGDGLAEDEPERRVAELFGNAVAQRLIDVLDATGDLPLEQAFATLGVQLDWRARHASDDTGKPSDSDTIGRPWFGATLAADDAGAKLVQVFTGSPAERAGLAPGDVVIAIGGYRVTQASLDGWLERHAELDAVDVHAFQLGRLGTHRLPVEPSPADTAVLDAADESRVARWLGTETGLA